MEISNKLGLQQIAFNHSLDIYFRDFMNLYKKCTTKLYSFLVINVTLASDNPLRLERKNWNTMLTVKQQKFQHCHLEKLINMKILQVNKCYLLIKDE